MPKGRYDVAVITVIPAELAAVRYHLGIAEGAVRIYRGTRIFREATVFSTVHQRSLRVIVGCIGRASQADAALETATICREFDPALVILCGIAAGVRDKVRIGDVVIAREIVDLSLKVAEGGEYRERPSGARAHPKTVQMLAQFQPTDGLFAKSFAERCDLRITIPPGEEGIYRAHVTDGPSVHDAAIGSEDVLQRDQTMFAKMLETHQQIRAAEMEAGGFVKGCQDGEHSRPWLVVRGISDFGDTFKNDNFHHLAAHSAAAFTTDFLKRGADIMLADPKRARRWASSAPATIVATDLRAGAGSSIADLSGGGANEVSLQLATNPNTGADGQDGDFERLKEAWRRVPSRETLARLQALPDDLSWSQTPASSRAEVLRFIAHASLASDKERAAEFRKRADALAAPRPDDAVHLRWVLETEGPEALLPLVSEVTEAELWNLRLVALHRLQRSADLAADFEKPPPGITPDAESERLYAWAMLELGRFAEALTAANQAVAKQPHALGNRVVQAVAKYFSTIVSDHARRLQHSIPVPVNVAFILVDATALAVRREAEATFRELIGSALANTDFTEALEGWRLACLCTDPERQTEAREFCRELLNRQPPHPVAIPWAMARGYEPELDALNPPQKTET